MDKRYPKTAEILNFLKSGFILTSAFIAPNSLKGFGKIRPPFEKYEPRYLKRKLKELYSEDLIAKTMENGKEILKISQKGNEHLKKLNSENLKIQKPKEWDGKWRLIIFDIPAKLNKERYYFVNQLKKLGLYPLQESVYIYPYSCFTEINALRQISNVKRYVRFLVVEDIEGERELINKFSI